MVTALDDVATTRAPGPSGVWILEPSGGPARVAVAPAPAPSASGAPAAAPEPVRPSEPELTRPSPPKPSPTFTAPSTMPLRPAKPPVVEEEHIYPDAGDVVEHFAFGRCDVIKSDGDRLHLRLSKDGRIKEIALEMLKVTPLPPVEGSPGKHYKLDRRL
jgi:hypothetical protein